MSYRFDLDHSVESNVRRILKEQLEKALHQLTQTVTTDPAEAVHDVRKRLKKGRSVLRLVRKAMPKDTYKREKNSLRDLGRMLGSVRESETYRKTLTKLLEDNAIALDISAFEEVQRGLLDINTVRLAQMLDQDEPLSTVISGLKDAIARLQHLELDEKGWDAIGPNLKRLYRQGQQRMEKAYEDGGDRAFHDWRKRSKDLLYDIRLLRSLWPPMMKALKSEASQLTDYLGEDHDIADLRQFLLTHRQEADIHESQMEVLLPLMAQTQERLRQQARGLGERLYVESPKAFVHRMERYWQLGAAS